jgi:hypothetical protein
VAERLTYWPLRAKVSVAILAAPRRGDRRRGSEAGLQRETANRRSNSPDDGQVVITVTHDDGCGNTEHDIATDGPQRSSTATPPVEATPPAESNGSTLAPLRIADGVPSPPGYSRDLFPTWLDLDGNGCDAREDTLVAESRGPWFGACGHRL